ncbi:MCP four helix bundle domain-containing protein [Paraburkholderia caledonica]|uniref:MCP four helix bundle domain-containing protein n=1 Tax=Paraburkholderia caledonica TaxID=134536 RepID=UPI0033918B74
MVPTCCRHEHREKTVLNLKRVRIGTRLGIGFGMLLLLLAITGAMSLSQASHQSRSVRFGRKLVTKHARLGHVRAETNRVRRTTLGIILQVDAEERTSLRPMHDASLVRIVEALAKYEKLVSSPEEMRF